MRVIVLLFLLFFCNGCGFRPLYHVTDGKNILADVNYERIPDSTKNSRSTFFLNTEIERITGNDSTEIKPAKYLLKVDYDVSIDDYLIQDNSVANRKRIQITLKYKITELKGDKIIASGKLIDFDSFAVTESPYSDFVVEEDLTTEILVSLAQELRLQLISKLAGSSVISRK
jgi:hypothetical protein